MLSCSNHYLEMFEGMFILPDFTVNSGRSQVQQIAEINFILMELISIFVDEACYYRILQWELDMLLFNEDKICPICRRVLLA